jgi:hypothetical protein
MTLTLEYQDDASSLSLLETMNARDSTNISWPLTATVRSALHRLTNQEAGALTDSDPPAIVQIKNN